MGSPICNPFRHMQNPAGIPGRPPQASYHPKRDKSKTVSAADFMITKTSFLVKIIHRIGARSLRGKKFARKWSRILIIFRIAGKSPVRGRRRR